MSMNKEKRNIDVIEIIVDDSDNSGNAIQEYSRNTKELGRCISIDVRKFISLV